MFQSRRKSSDKEKKKSRHPDDHKDRRKSKEPYLAEAGPSSQGQRHLPVDFECLNPGCSVFNASNIHTKWPDLKYIPRPEPDPNFYGPHQKWLKEYNEWRNLQCDGGKGYFCRRHGMWITCAEIDLNRAPSKEDELDGSCPNHHYARDDAVVESVPPLGQISDRNFNQLSENPDAGFDEGIGPLVDPDAFPLASLPKHMGHLDLQGRESPGGHPKHERGQPYLDFDYTDSGEQPQWGDVSRPDEDPQWEPHIRSDSIQRTFQGQNEDEVQGSIGNRRSKIEGKAVSYGRGQDYSRVTHSDQRVRSSDLLHPQDAGFTRPTQPTPIPQVDETKDYYDSFGSYDPPTSGGLPSYGLPMHQTHGSSGEDPASQFYGQESYDQDYTEISSQRQQRQRRKHQR